VLKDPRGGLGRHQQQVSILVFLDQALKAFSLLPPLVCGESFNPCFPGSSAERKNSTRPVSSRAVSILVFLDQALKGQTGAMSAPIKWVSILVFLDQALKEGERSGHVPSWRVSILVFLDQALKDVALFALPALLFLFQSLFSWIKR